MRLEGEGRWAEAADAFQRAAEIDPEHAETAYRLGRCEARLGRDAEARRHLELARDLDTLRFRADTRTNAIVREVARREARRPARRTPKRRSRAQSPHGAPGDESFLDHVHLTFHGNYLLGVALLEQVREALPERGARGRARGARCRARRTSRAGSSTPSSTATASPRRCSSACATPRSRTSPTTPST